MLINSKIDRIENNLNIQFYDNGYVIEVSGHQNDEWKVLRLLCTTLEELNAKIAEARAMIIS
jgi:hypothetical protein